MIGPYNKSFDHLKGNVSNWQNGLFFFVCGFRKKNSCLSFFMLGFRVAFRGEEATRKAWLLESGARDSSFVIREKQFCYYLVHLVCSSSSSSSSSNGLYIVLCSTNSHPCYHLSFSFSVAASLITYSACREFKAWSFSALTSNDQAHHPLEYIVVVVYESRDRAFKEHE